MTHHKVRNQQLSSEGPSVAEALKIENEELKFQVIALTEEVKLLNVEVKDLTKQLLNSHTTKSARIKMLLKSPTPKPSSS